MAVVFENRVIEVCATLGTGNLLVSGADPGYSTFAEMVPVGSTIHYLCESINAVGRPTGEFELGRGTYVAANTISRDTVVSSSSAGDVVDFTQASKRLSLTVLAPTASLIRGDWREAIGSQFEPGHVFFHAGKNAPPGSLKANGASIAVVSYPDLAAVLYCGDNANPTALFGYRTNSTTSPSTNRSAVGAYIVLPDLQGEFIRGWDGSRGVDVGRVFGSAQVDAFRAHNHGISGDNVFGTAGTFSYYPGPGRTPHTSETVGGGETRPRNIALLPVIKY